MEGETVFSEKEFSDLVASKIKDQELSGRVFQMFKNYGPYLSCSVMNAFLHAVDQEDAGKVGIISMVLNSLNEYWEHTLGFQHPEIRGQVLIMGVNREKVLFKDIFENVLGLRPKPTN